MIISASRRTDIPAFYSDWFLTRLQDGFVYVINPMNRKQVSKVSLHPDKIECIVFWTKNPKKLLPKLEKINQLRHNFYFQFTVTSYDKRIEVNVPKKDNILHTFRELSEKIGKEKVIWRYDPIFLSNNFSYQYHIKWFAYIAKYLSGYTDKCIISFIDMYKKCERNMKDLEINRITDIEKINLSKELFKIAQNEGIIVESCAESTELQNIGINHGKCIDDVLISQIVNKKIKASKDKNQRNECGCVTSIDIGSYNSCNHNCKYCYANFNQELVHKNRIKHDVQSPLLIGHLQGDEKITERKMSIFISKQQSFF